MSRLTPLRISRALAAACAFLVAVLLCEDVHSQADGWTLVSNQDFKDRLYSRAVTGTLYKRSAPWLKQDQYTQVVELKSGRKVTSHCCADDSWSSINIRHPKQIGESGSVTVEIRPIPDRPNQYSAAVRLSNSYTYYDLDGNGSIDAYITSDPNAWGSCIVLDGRFVEIGLYRARYIDGDGSIDREALSHDKKIEYEFIENKWRVKSMKQP